jgi:sterol desaturase/sphingolipid hydroxylase (fatty acid hydroxylase superfamily)
VETRSQDAARIDDSSATPTRGSTRVGMNPGAIAIAAALAVIAVMLALAMSAWHLGWLERAPRKTVENWDTLLVDWRLWLFIPAILVLERLFPVGPRQGMLTVGGAQDALWFVLYVVFDIVLIKALGRFFGNLHEMVGSPAVDLEGVFGSTVVAALFAFLVADFLVWFHHFVRHKVPPFWEFHAVHHSQPQLSMFTDSRVHVVDSLIARTIIFVPSLLLGLAVPTIIGLETGRAFFARFYHSNIRTNLGPLRFLVVTPQSHRVHHSLEPAHRDKNFGVTFSIWDQMFRTQYRGWDEYPVTGVVDTSFPLERSARPVALARTYVAQLLYPLKTVTRWVFART